MPATLHSVFKCGYNQPGDNRRLVGEPLLFRALDSLYDVNWRLS
jgi:hypothetical protein